MILPNPSGLLGAGCQIEENNKNKLDPFFLDSGKDDSYQGKRNECPIQLEASKIDWLNVAFIRPSFSSFNVVRADGTRTHENVLSRLQGQVSMSILA
jgi:hypothetical protein